MSRLEYLGAQIARWRSIPAVRSMVRARALVVTGRCRLEV